MAQTVEERREAARVRMAARRARLRADPVVWAAYRERVNARLRRVDAKRREDPAEREKDAARFRALRRRKKGL